MASESYLPIGCYGKLPCARDFLSWNVSFPTSLAIKNWLHAGNTTLLHAQDAGPDIVETHLGSPGVIVPAQERETAREVIRDDVRGETARLRVLFGLPGSVELLAAVVRPSTDQNGLRSFPFAVFTHFPRRLYGKRYALLPLGLAGVWDALDDASDNLAGLATRAAFDEFVSAALIPPPAPLAETRAAFERQTTQSARTMFDREDGATYDALVRNLPDFVAALREEKGGLKIQLPVSSDLERSGYDAAVWMALFNHQFLWKRFEPNIFLDEAKAQKSRNVLLAFGPPSGADYALIMGCGSGEVARPALSSAGEVAPAGPPVPEVPYSELLGRKFVA